MNTFNPYGPDVIQAVLHGHLGLLDSIEPDDDGLPCGEVVGTSRDGDGLILEVKWDGEDEERVYRLTIGMTG